MPQFVETLIVGAGLSGLNLAMQLSASDHSFHLIEARQRLGGRILTDNLTGADLGPAWFWPAHSEVSKLVDQFSLPVIEQYVQGQGLFQTASGVHKIPPSPAETSFRLQGGMQQLIDALKQSLPNSAITLGAALTNVSKCGDYIEATFAKEGGGQFVQRCNSLVLAIPPRIAAEQITFMPALPSEVSDQWRAVPTWMAGHAKTIMVFEKPIWKTLGFNGFAFSQTGPLMEIHDASTEHCHALFGFFGWSAMQRQHATENELKTLISAQVNTLYGSKPTRIIIQDWAKESFTSINADRATPQYHPQYGRHVNSIWNDRLLLCSTESASLHGGYLEGALISSNHAFRELMKSYPE